MIADLVPELRRLIREEVQVLRSTELGVVQGQHPHESDGDTDNYAVTVRLRDTGIVLSKVPVATGRLADVQPQLSAQSAVTVIMAAHGYPGTPKGGGLIREIEAAEQVPGVTVFHAGTARSGESLVAKGGRVLAVTAVADTFANARARAYRAVDQIDFADGFHRTDIGWRELERTGAMAVE